MHVKYGFITYDEIPYIYILSYLLPLSNNIFTEDPHLHLALFSKSICHLQLEGKSFKENSSYDSS
jgi:hypothetical protein